MVGRMTLVATGPSVALMSWDLSLCRKHDGPLAVLAEEGVCIECILQIFFAEAGQVSVNGVEQDRRVGGGLANLEVLKSEVAQRAVCEHVQGVGTCLDSVGTGEEEVRGEDV